MVQKVNNNNDDNDEEDDISSIFYSEMGHDDYIHVLAKYLHESNPLLTTWTFSDKCKECFIEPGKDFYFRQFESMIFSTSMDRSKFLALKNDLLFFEYIFKKKLKNNKKNEALLLKKELKSLFQLHTDKELDFAFCTIFSSELTNNVE
jgi:hypothetical protein